jgi:NADH dehydrogenase FAD-containing subunit
MGKHLVLVGGGHAHMVTLANLNRFIVKGHRVTVIGPSEYHYYSGMGPGMLGTAYQPDDIRFATRQIVEKQGGTFIKDTVTHIDAQAKSVFLASGAAIDYDVSSFNAGSFVSDQIVKQDTGDIFSVKPIEKLIQARARLVELMAVKPIAIAVVGGGPAAAEMAGNVWDLARHEGKHLPQIKVFAGKHFMPRFPAGIRRKVYKALSVCNVSILTNGYVREIETGALQLENGKSYAADVIFIALGVTPSAIFKDSGLPVGPDNGLLVNTYLQSTGYPDIFGGGDCIYFQEQPLDKVGVYAVRQNPVLFHNLMAALENKPLAAFDPGGDYLLIFNMGGGRGVLKKGALELKGRLAFILKDFIDRRFMKKFKAIE